MNLFMRAQENFLSYEKYQKRMDFIDRFQFQQTVRRENMRNLGWL